MGLINASHAACSLGVDQVLYAYSLRLKEGTTPKELDTADLNFPFPFSEAFCCVSLPYLLQRIVDRTGFQNH